MGNYKIQGNEGEIAETDRSPGKSDHITTLERCTVLSKNLSWITAHYQKSVTNARKNKKLY